MVTRIILAVSPSLTLIRNHIVADLTCTDLVGNKIKWIIPHHLANPTPAFRLISRPTSLTRRCGSGLSASPEWHGILTCMPKKKESEFDKLARLIKEEGEDIRGEMGAMEKRLEHKMDEGFLAVNRRLDQIIQMQLDEHAGRIKNLETAVFPK
jgi:hypothetical protein